MAQGNNFLSIPKQEGLFMAIRSERSGEDRNGSPIDDEDDEETEEDVRLIPRSSPIPRKRGHSLTDETAEYMRIRLALPSRRVSFADTTGRELVDVREFVPFDSDEEDDSRWEEEEAKYRKAYRKPTYTLHPEFQPLTETELVLALHTNKVEVESVSFVADEPLAFDGVIRVLNISFQKSVYVRSTMDGWLTHFDYPAEYVPGSNDGETDKFSVRLTFAEPYLFNGARIDFVVRYETCDGEFWANNSGRNYSVTLLQSYEEATPEVSKVDSEEIRGILKPPRYRMEDDDYDPSLDDEGNVTSTKREADGEVPCPACPVLIEPEIDIETAAECTLPSVGTMYDEQPLQDSSEIPPQTNCPETTDPATESPLPTELPTVSVQQLAEVSDNVPSSQSDRPYQVPSDITSPAIFPSMQYTEEDRSGKLEEKEKQYTVVRRETQTQDQTFDIVEVDKTDTSLQVLQDSVQSCSFKELSTDSANKDEMDLSPNTHHGVLSADLQNPLEETPEMQTAKDVSEIRTERIEMDNTQAAGEDLTDTLVTPSELAPEVTCLGLTRKDRTTQSHPTPPTMFDPEVPRDHQPGPGSGSEPKVMGAIICVDADTLSASVSTDFKEGSVTFSNFTTITKTGSPQGKCTAPSTTEEEPVIEEFQLVHDEPAPLQTQAGQESQLPLPHESAETQSAQSEAMLDKTLIPSIAFFSAAVCLAVGFQEPIVFLVVGLFLVSLCF